MGLERQFSFTKPFADEGGCWIPKQQYEYGSIGNGHVELEEIKSEDNTNKEVDKSFFVVFSFGNSEDSGKKGHMVVVIQAEHYLHKGQNGHAQKYQNLWGHEVA